jgi:hypothetical protein
MVIRVEDRTEYLAALDRASIDLDIVKSGKNDGVSGQTPGRNDAPGEQPLKTRVFQVHGKGLQNLQAKVPPPRCRDGRCSRRQIERRHDPTSLLASNVAAYVSFEGPRL